jgi:hypothetical protein
MKTSCLEEAGGCMHTEHSWAKTYHDAILETDWTRIEEKVEAAEIAIRVRRHEFSLNHGGTPEENQDIEDAPIRAQRSAERSRRVAIKTHRLAVFHPSERGRESSPTGLTVWGRVITAEYS